MACNSSFSLDEEYLAVFISVVLSGSTAPQHQINQQAGRILRHSAGLRARIERAKAHVRTIGGDTRLVWRPEPERITRVVTKNARGHAFFELGEPMLWPPLHARFASLSALKADERAAFERIEFGAILPEAGSRMMTRLITSQGLLEGWVIVQEEVYRYAVLWRDQIIVRSVLFECFATETIWER